MIFRIITPLILWQAICSIFQVPSYILPDAFSVARVFKYKFEFILFHTGISLFEVISALCLGFITAFFTAIFLFQDKKIEKLFMPYLVIFKNLPIFIFAPLFMLWFGHGLFSKIILITLSCYFPMTIGFLDGLSRTPQAIEDILHNIPQKNFLRELLIVRLPYALPSFFTANKLAFLHAPLSVIACDWIGAHQGLGYIMLIAYGQMDLEIMFACIFILLVLGLFFFRFSGFLERYFTHKLNLQHI